MGKTLFVLGLAACSLGASAPSTQPSDYWSQREANLRADTERMQKYFEDLRRQQLALRAPTTRPIPQGRLEMPNAVPPQLRWREPANGPTSRPSANPYDGGASLVPPTSQPGGVRFRFNGEDVYLIPLRTKRTEASR